MDKAGKAYWDGVWDGAALPAPVDPAQPGLNNHVNRAFHRIFQRYLRELPPATTRLLEVGCARSAWLPYFAREYRFEVTGLDYSEGGCAQARAILEKAEVEGTVVCADFFNPPEAMLGTCDVVVSFGVAEHFQNTAECLRAFGRFLRPGGRIITTIPNLSGAIGFLQRHIDRSIYDVHVPLNRGQLREAHEKAGFGVLACDYFVSANFNVLNVSNWRSRAGRAAAYRTTAAVSKLFWMTERFGVTPNAFTSPYIYCAARKP